MKPNFIFIGPDKSGSTWLWRMLCQHPDVYVAPCKDIYYFDRYYSKGADWYESHFRDAKQSSAIGEFSHDYLISNVACARIKADLPNVKLITILRNPIDRAFSEYLYIRKHCLINSDVSFRDAALAIPSILEGGMYARHLCGYLKKFDKEQLFLGNYEDIGARPDDFLLRLCVFLEIDKTFRFNAPGWKVLSASKARNAWIARYLKQLALLARDHGLGNLVGLLKHSAIVQTAMYKEYKDSEKPTMSVGDRNWLREMYAEDVEKLGGLLNRSFEEWLRPSEKA